MKKALHLSKNKVIITKHHFNWWNKKSLNFILDFNNSSIIICPMQIQDPSLMISFIQSPQSMMVFLLSHCHLVLSCQDVNGGFNLACLCVNPISLISDGLIKNVNSSFYPPINLFWCELYVFKISCFKFSIFTL